MDLFNSKNKQALITAQNRAAMYNPSRPSECNTDGTAFKKSSDNLDLIKGGEGSKGGKVIGHTKSGKPIYDHHDHEGHKDFSRADHSDAVKAHLKKMNSMFDKRYGGSNAKRGGILIGGEGNNVEAYQHHEDQAFKHTDSMHK